MRNLATAVALSTAAFAGLALAQDPVPTPQPAPTFAEETQVTEVLIDAVVTDRDGNVIVGLGEDDFTVTENGKPVPLTDVKFYSSRARVDAAGKQLEPAQAQRLFILFFHDQRDMNVDVPGILARELDAGRRAREWVRTLGPNDYVAVAAYDKSLALTQDFTRDRQAIERGIDEAVTGKAGEGNWPSRQPPGEGPSLLRHLPKGHAVRDQSPTIYEALQVLARAGQNVVGRKNLILLSSGFGEVNTFGQFTPDPRYDQPTFEVLNDGNVAVYTIDLLTDTSDSPLSSALSLMATETGGRYFQNVVNFVLPLQQVAQETTGYYLLAYDATHPRGTSGFQKVAVTVRNPDFRVKAREGYQFGD